MLNSLNLTRAIPSVPQANAHLDLSMKGTNLNTAVYIAPTPIAGAAQSQLTVTVNTKAPGLPGSSRGQLLLQHTLLDAAGKPRVVSANLTVSIPKDFVPPAGITVDLHALTRETIGSLIGYLGNPGNVASGQTPNAVIDAIYTGVLP